MLFPTKSTNRRNKIKHRGSQKNHNNKTSWTKWPAGDSSMLVTAHDCLISIKTSSSLTGITAANMIMIRVRILVAMRHQTLSDDKVIVVMEFLRGRTEKHSQ